MNSIINENTRLIDITLGDLAEFLLLQPKTVVVQQQPEKRYVHGINGIAELFGCSRATAFEIKRSGKINEAISQTGKTIIVDAEKALSLIKLKKDKR